MLVSLSSLGWSSLAFGLPGISSLLWLPKNPRNASRIPLLVECSVSVLSSECKLFIQHSFSSTSHGPCHVQFSSVTESIPTLCDPMDCSMPGLPVHHQFPEFTQTHVHWASDAIQPSHPLSSPSPPTFNLSQHQGLFQWVRSLHEVAKVLEFQLQHQSLFRTAYSGLISLRMDFWILLSKGLSRVFSNTTVQKYQFFGAQLSLQSNSHIHTWLLEKP